MKKIIILIFVLSFSSSLFSQIVTERPTQSESAVVLPKNSFQIESGMIVQKAGDELNTPLNIHAPITLFRFGICKYFELRFLTQYQNDMSFGYYNFPYIVSGFNDIEIGTKVQLFKNEKSKTQIAFLSHLSIPAGAESFTNHEYVTINKVAVSHGITDYLGLGYNVGYVYDFSGISSLIFSLSAGYGINDRFSIFVEPYGNITEFSEYEISINGGFAYLINDHLQADFSFGTGINHLMNFYGVGFGWNIARNETE